jgi:hypothetical protein
MIVDERHVQTVPAACSSVCVTAPPAPRDLYRSACVLALAARDGGLPLAVRDARAERQAWAALVLLERVRQAGDIRTAKNCREMERDDDLGGLRDRADFRAWLANWSAYPGRGAYSLRMTGVRSLIFFAPSIAVSDCTDGFRVR